MSGKNHVSLTEAKQRLGELVKRAAYGGERFVLEFRDKPQAALVSYADLKRLELTSIPLETRLQTLTELDKVRERISRRTGKLPDSSKEIAEMREERDAELEGLR